MLPESSEDSGKCKGFALGAAGLAAHVSAGLLANGMKALEWAPVRASNNSFLCVSCGARVETHCLKALSCPRAPEQGGLQGTYPHMRVSSVPVRTYHSRAALAF